MIGSYILGAFIFLWIASKDARKLSEALWVLLIIIATALVGSKFSHVLFEAKGHLLSDNTIARNFWDLLKDDPWHVLRFSDPGYVFFGGLVACLLIGALWHKMRSYADYAVPGLCLGIFFGRLGCFETGCCYGVHDLPVQLFDACFGLVLLFKVRKMQDFLIYYSLWRFGLEFLRADESRGIWALGLSTSQWIALGVLTTALKSSQMRQTRIKT